MLYRLRRELRRHRFDKAIGDVLSTPPMPLVEAPLTIVSMVSSADVPMNILSMKAFYRRLGRGRLVAIIDRDTPAAARRTLEHHFPGIAFEILEAIDTGSCQRGGTWERVLHILDRAASGYVVQVDCDTLPITADIQEVANSIKAGVAFPMATTMTEAGCGHEEIARLRAAAHRSA